MLEGHISEQASGECSEKTRSRRPTRARHHVFKVTSETLLLESGRWFLSKGIGEIEFAHLGAMLDVGTYGSLMDEFKLVGEPRNEGPWPGTMPAALIDRIRTISDDDISVVAPKWSEIEEFRGAATSENLADFLKRLRQYLADRSGDFFLINAL